MPPSVPEADLTTMMSANLRRYTALNPNRNSRQEGGWDIGSWLSDADKCIYSVGSRQYLAPALAEACTQLQGSLAPIIAWRHVNLRKQSDNSSCQLPRLQVFSFYEVLFFVLCCSKVSKINESVHSSAPFDDGIPKSRLYSHHGLCYHLDSTSWN